MRIRIFNMDELPWSMDDLREGIIALFAGQGIRCDVTYGKANGLLSLDTLRWENPQGDLPRNRSRYLKPKDWLFAFDTLNGWLDLRDIDAIVDTLHYRVRVGRHHRIVLDDQFNRATKLFDLRRTAASKYGKPADYSPAPYSVLTSPKGKDLRGMITPKME